MEALSAAGFPVFAERGSGGGWMLVEGYRTNLTGLNKDEIQALFLTKPLRLLADLGLEKASNAALLKLSAALPSTHRDNAEQARQRIHIDLSGWNRSNESIEFLPAVQEAIWQQRKLRLTYQRGGGCDPVERLLDPLGLVAKGSVWYLVAAVDDTLRSYRVSSILGVEQTGEQCVRPKGFDLAAFWEQSTASFKASLPQYKTTIRIAPEAFPFMRFAGRFARVLQTDAPDADGWIRVTLRFDVEEMAIGYALSFGEKLEVLEPTSLRTKVIEEARNLIRFYENK
jgi:predicted DNA-binding transcriptional regulator YafY